MNPINEALARLFRDHGVPSVEEGEWLSFPSRRLKLASRIRDERQAQGLHSIQLDIFFAQEAESEIAESFGGFGDTPAEAIEDAIENFAASSLHVLLAAFFPDVPTDHANVEEWVIGGAAKRIVMGNLTMRGDCPQRTEFIPLLNERFEREIKARDLSSGLHWIRLYQARGGTTAINEVLLDNEPDSAFQAAMGSMPWPASPSFYSVRLFLVVQDRMDGSPRVEAKDVGNRPWWRFWR